MKKLLTGFCFLPVFAFAQNFHFSARLGIAGYQGDLKAHAISFSQTNLLGSIGARYDLTEHIAARGYFTLSSLEGDDKLGTSSMQLRNLNFKTSLFDFEVGGQYNFFNLNDRWWTPYAFVGIGFFHFNPYTADANGNKVFLQPLSTEGEGFVPGVKEYKKMQFSIPFGFGADYSLNEDMKLGLEFGYRKTFTDQLDDASGNYVDQATLLSARGQTAVDLAWRGDEINRAPYPPGGTVRGNSGNKDGYYYVALTYTVRYFFDKYKQVAGMPGYKRDRKVGCPSTRY
jgi:hypothetical protein